MKFKSILAVALAALAFTACSNDDDTLAGANETKTVKLDISGVFAGTRSQTAAIEDGSAVQVNNIEVYLTDGKKFYTGYAADGKTEVAWDMNYSDWSNASLTNVYKKSYHFVPSAVDNVIVVGNTNNDLATTKTYADEKAVNAAIFTIGTQQDTKALSLYGEAGSLTKSSTNDDDDNQPLYTANVVLKPLVSRLEISAFQYTGTNYSNLTVKDVFFTNYYETAALSTGMVTSLNTLTTDETSQSKVFQTLTEKITTGAWYNDSPALKLDGTKETSVGNNPLAYNFFTCGTIAIPQVVVWLQSTNNDGTIQNLYLKTSGFYKADTYVKDDLNTEADETKKENAITSTNQVYQTKFVFGDEHLDNPEKCIDLTVSVIDWDLVPVITEFE